MTDLRQYHSVREATETIAIKKVEMYIKDYSETTNGFSQQSYGIEPYGIERSYSIKSGNKEMHQTFATRFLEPMLFSSGYWGTVKYYTKRGKITEVVTISEMTEEEKKDNLTLPS